MSAQEFIKNEDGYIKWIESHPNGFVINTEKSKNPSYMVLHRADCYHISTYNAMSKPGGFTTRQFIKICAMSKDDLREWVKVNGRQDGSFSSECPNCNP